MKRFLTACFVACLAFSFVVAVSSISPGDSPTTPEPFVSPLPEPSLSATEKSSVNFHFTGARKTSASQEADASLARVYVSKNCEQVTLLRIDLNNNADESKKVFSGSMLRISRSDSKNTYAYDVALFDFLSGDLVSESGSQTTIKTAKIVCSQNFGSLSAGSYIKKSWWLMDAKRRVITTALEERFLTKTF